jgi:hypothetical protein
MQHSLRSHVVDNVVGDAPPYEIQLGDRRGHSVKLDPFRPTERVEQLFGITIQARLVSDVDGKLTTGRGHVRHVLILRVVGHEPLEVPERNTLAMTQDVDQLLAVLRYVKKTRERIEQKLTLAHYPHYTCHFYLIKGYGEHAFECHRQTECRGEARRKYNGKSRGTCSTS